MTNRRQVELTEAYRGLQRKVTLILYEEDPAECGSSVGAPEDEYTEEATRLIAHLKDPLTREEAHRIVTAMFPNASESLIGRVYEEWVRFADRLRTPS